MFLKKKIKKLINNPNLFFYDFFRKRCGIATESIRNDSFNDRELNILEDIIDKKIREYDKKNNHNNMIFSIYKNLLRNIQKYNKYENIWEILKNKKIIIRKQIWCEHYKNFFDNIEYINPYFIDESFNSAECLLIHGQGSTLPISNDIELALEKNIYIFNSEDGFLHSIVRPADTDYEKIYRIGYSLIIDTKGIYFDSTRPSDLEDLLNSDLIISNSEIKRANDNIKFIRNNFISKYNNQPIFKPQIGRSNVKKILVIDQALNDFSIKLGGCTSKTFNDMLLSAINENPGCDILVKVHPDMISNPNRGGTETKKYGHYTNFDFSKYDNIYFIAEYINPICLLEYVDKVYVATSQMGFEALFCGKEVVIFGTPFYAGWGCGDLRSKNFCLKRRTKNRTIEEIFYIAYILYSRYAHPLKKKQCSIEDILEHILLTRNMYMNQFNIKHDIYFTNNTIISQNKNVINIAFSFDINYYRQAVVAMLSLLESSKEVTYNIYCLHAADLNENSIYEITSYLKNHKNMNKIDFINMDQYISDGYECRGISKAAYSRLFIHDILQDIDKIIYSDVDVIFNKDLYDVYNFNYGNYLAAACIDVGQNTQKLFNKNLANLPYWKLYMANLKGNYFSDGFLVLNLKLIRNSHIDKIWRSMITYEFLYQEMDILNATINDYIFPLHSKYCVIPRLLKELFYENGVKERFIPKTTLSEIYSNPIIYHYSGKKPWDDKKVIGADIWWTFIKKYKELYEYFDLRYTKKALSNCLINKKQ